jgi:uncharacterized protein
VYSGEVTSLTDSQRGLLPRGVFSRVEALLAAVPVVVIEGPRGSGKSALGRLLGQRGLIRTIVDLGDPTLRDAALASPVAFVEGLARPALIDEAQLVPELTLAVKRVVDVSGAPGQFVLTGSSRLGRAQLGGSDPLAGRAARVRLWPMTQGELEGRARNLVADLVAGVMPARSLPALGRDDLLSRVRRGGLPLLAGVRSPVDAVLRPSLVGEYVEGVLEHEVGRRHDRAELQRTLRYLAASTSRLLNVATVASELGSKRETVQSRLATLESTFLLHTVPAHRSLEHRVLTAHPKVHAIDTALACWAGRVTTSPSAVELGGLVETFVVNELAAQSDWCLGDVSLRHWRDTARKLEVDAMLVGDGNPIAIEVKAAPDVRPGDLLALRAVLADDPNATGLVFYTGGLVLDLGDRLRAIPMTALWEPC